MSALRIVVAVNVAMWLFIGVMATYIAMIVR